MILEYFLQRGSNVKHIAFIAQQERVGQPAGFLAGSLTDWADDLRIVRILNFSW
jgi:hypothetical protein